MSAASKSARALLAEPLGAQVLIGPDRDRVLAEIRGMLATLTEEVEQWEAPWNKPKVLVAASKAQDENRRLYLVLNRLRRGSCFCEKGIGNPMVSEHTAACIEATALLKP